MPPVIYCESKVFLAISMWTARDPLDTSRGTNEASQFTHASGSDGASILDDKQSPHGVSIHVNGSNASTRAERDKPHAPACFVFPAMTVSTVTKQRVGGACTDWICF